MDIATFVKFWAKIRVNREAGLVFSGKRAKNSGWYRWGNPGKSTLFALT